MKRLLYGGMFLCIICGVLMTQNRAAAQQIWPYPIPCRIRDGENKNLLFMTLGDVKTVVADGMYDPVKDVVILKNGTTVQNYYRDSLRIRYYKPIDKKIYPLPPSGWCSWYFYYRAINETEVMRNAQWIAENLKDYGAQYVQIDDGWQGEGTMGTRDWTNLSERFKGGMDKLAAYIKSVGLSPGIWLAPHGQSNDAVVKNNPGVFLLRPNDSTASNTWEGKYLTDPSTPEAHKYLNDLFTKFTKWGYEYFKIDGQPTVVTEFRTKKSFMKNPIDDTNELYRKTLETIRTAIGPNRYLLGCWGIPLEGVGIMNGSRVGGDVVIGWDGFLTALRATMAYYYQHNIVWYTDPDVMLLRYPLTVDQARVWATLQGLTGMGLMSSDRLMDLGEERVEMMRRVYPAVDIRPLDLFPAGQNKRIWDLKVNHLNRIYDVVGVFNFNQDKPDQIYLNWKDLGIPETGFVHVYDFWNKEYLGAWEKGMIVDLAPTSCRVLTLLPNTDQIQLISTSRHITQGWVDLVSLAYDPTKNSYAGKSKVIKNDPYELRFAFPTGKNFKVKQAAARTSSGDLPVKVTNHQFWAAVQVIPSQTTEITWDVSFEPTDIYTYRVGDPTGVRIERVGFDGVMVRWGAQYYLNVGYQVYLNGELLGYTPQNSFPITGLDPKTAYTVEVKTVWEDGTLNPRKVERQFNIADLLPSEMYLTELEPIRTGGGRGMGGGRSVPAGPLTVGGKQYERGIGARAGSDVEYSIKGAFSTFSAQMSIDDRETNVNANVEFILIGDGKELWRSGGMLKTDGLKPVQVNIAGVKQLVLRVTDFTGGSGRYQVDWIDPKVIK